MKLWRKILLAIIWVLVVVGCVFVIRNSNKAKKTQKNSIEMNGSITKITSARTKVEEHEKENNNRTEIMYICKLYQSIQVSYEMAGKEYTCDFSDIESYSQTSDMPFTTGEKSEIQNTKGYKVGESVALYVNEKNPADAHLKRAVDRAASGMITKVLLLVVIFMGFVLSSCVLMGANKRRY